MKKAVADDFPRPAKSGFLFLVSYFFSSGPDREEISINHGTVRVNSVAMFLHFILLVFPIIKLGYPVPDQVYTKRQYFESFGTKL